MAEEMPPLQAAHPGPIQAANRGCPHSNLPPLAGEGAIGAKWGE